MRTLLFSVFTAGSIMALAGGAQAADDFGNSFSNQTPQAFDDPSPEALAARMGDDMGAMDASSLANIMPAAGEEEEMDDAESMEADHQDEVGPDDMTDAATDSDESAVSEETSGVTSDVIVDEAPAESE